MALPSVRSFLIVLVLSTWVTPSRAAGDAEAMKLAMSAMETDFRNDDFDAADDKLLRAESVCRRKTCERSLYSGIYGYFAIVSWVADRDKDTTLKYLKYMLQISPQEKLDKDYAPEEMEPLLKQAQQELRGSATPNGAPSAKEPEEKLPSAAEQRASAARTAAEEKKAAQREAAEDARKAAEDKKEAARDAAEDARKTSEEKKDAARVAAEEKKQAARIAFEEKKENARKAAEEKKEAARLASDEKKETARKAAEEKKEAAEEARKAAEEKKEAARLASDEKKEAARKAAEDARTAAAEKKEAARKAAEEKKAENARKAEEARLAEIDKRIKTPPPRGKLVEEPWKGQAIGYPVFVRVKLPPPPPKIEPERVEVVKVVTEFSGPGVPAPTKIELRPNKDGAYEGSLPCEISKQEGEVTYYTTAYNKYDNVVASGGSIDKPNQVQIKAELASRLGHMPGELPPISCEESARRAKTAAPKCEGDGCNQKPAVATAGPTCEGKDCGGAAPNLPTIKPSGRGCLRCVIGTPKGTTDWEALAGLGVAVVYFARRRVRRAAD